MVTVKPTRALKTALKKIKLPKPDSHKGQNGRLLIIGGSSLFHAASLWSAAIASRIVDIVHYCSTKENEKVFVNLKSKFVDGIVVKKEDMLDYVEEDDCVLLGPGMVRGKINSKFKSQPRLNPGQNLKFSQILKIEDEATYTYYLTKFLSKNFPQKKFVFDAGSLQMMEKDWLLAFKEKPILTPHKKEFERLFGVSLDSVSKAKKQVVEETAKKYHCVLLLKIVDDIISSDQQTVTVKGGNAGLTKGGTGDVLAGLTAALAAKNDSFISCLLASYFVNQSAEELFEKAGLWYNASDLVFQIPKTMKKKLI